MTILDYDPSDEYTEETLKCPICRRTEELGHDGLCPYESYTIQEAIDVYKAGPRSRKDCE